MKTKMLTIAACLLSVAFWFFDSSVHYLVYDEPNFEIIPGDFNELWMRVVIVTLMMLFGIFGDHYTNNVHLREKQLEVARVYNGMIEASLNILVNLLNQMEIFKLEAQKSRDFDREVIRLYDNAIDEASNLVDTLSRMHDITDRKIGEPPLNTQLFIRSSGEANHADTEDDPGR